MAEFCSQCSPFEDGGAFEFDLVEIALGLKEGWSVSFLCEGCRNRAVYKDETGQLFLERIQADGTIEMVEVTIDELSSPE